MTDTPHVATPEELRSLEQRWRWALEGSDLGVWDWDIGAGTVVWSPAWKSMLGYAEDEIGDQLDEWSSRVHPDDLPAVMALIDEHFRGASPSYESRHRMRARDGRWHTILDRGRVVAHDHEGKPLRMVGTHTDLTPLVEAQQRLAENEARQRAVLGAMNEGVVVFDAAGVVVFSNAAAERILGVSAAELERFDLTSPQWIALRPDGSEFPAREFPAARTLASGQPCHGVVMGVLRGNGALVWIEGNSAPIAGPGGTGMAGVVTTFADVTARRSGEEKLRQSEERLHDMLEAVPLGMALATTGGQLVQVNAAMPQLLGQDSLRLLHMSLADLVIEPDRPAASAAFARVVAGAEPLCRLEVRCPQAPAGETWCGLTLSALRDAERRVTGVLLVFEDISARHAAAELAARHTAQTMRTNQMHRDLQQAGDEDGVIDAVARALGDLFPWTQGALLLDDAAGEFVARGAWGGMAADLRVGCNDCPLLFEGGRSHAGIGNCGIGHGAPGAGHYCLPLVVDGRSIGVAYLSCAGSFSDPLFDSTVEALRLALDNLRLRRRLQYAASHDALTGLFNRGYLDETLPRELARVRRSGRPLVVALADADHFKRFNDTHGHPAGDALLTALGRLFAASLRQTDLAVRYGGEEFVLLLADTPLAPALERLQAIRAELARQRFSGQAVTMSIGVAEAPGHGETAEAILKAADDALYAAKHAGRDRICVATSQQAADQAGD